MHSVGSDNKVGIVHATIMRVYSNAILLFCLLLDLCDHLINLDLSPVGKILVQDFK